MASEATKKSHQNEVQVWIDRLNPSVGIFQEVLSAEVMKDVPLSFRGRLLHVLHEQKMRGGASASEPSYLQSNSLDGCMGG